MYCISDLKLCLLVFPFMYLIFLAVSLDFLCRIFFRDVCSVSFFLYVYPCNYLTFGHLLTSTERKVITFQMVVFCLKVVCVVSRM